MKANGFVYERQGKTRHSDLSEVQSTNYRIIEKVSSEFLSSLATGYILINVSNVSVTWMLIQRIIILVSFQHLPNPKTPRDYSCVEMAHWALAH